MEKGRRVSGRVEALKTPNQAMLEVGEAVIVMTETSGGYGDR
jgi:N-methylhydantoinase B/oxoprolinase/acetone carboxylase alpha subunit